MMIPKILEKHRKKTLNVFTKAMVSLEKNSAAASSRQSSLNKQRERIDAEAADLELIKEANAANIMAINKVLGLN